MLEENNVPEAVDEETTPAEEGSSTDTTGAETSIPVEEPQVEEEVEEDEEEDESI